MTVDPDKAAGRYHYKGQDYFFCSLGCLEKFKANPAKFLSQGHVAAVPSTTVGRAQNQYSCPMHPEILQHGAGSCPKCGMALERTVAASPVLEKTEYVCPMHPEVVQDAPGSCPICGMVLGAFRIGPCYIEELSNI